MGPLCPWQCLSLFWYCQVSSLLPISEGGRLRREKVDKDGRELPTKKKGGGDLPTGGLLASGCTTAYIGIFIIMLGMSHSRDYAVSFNNVQNKLSSSSHLLSSSSSSKLAASLNTKYSWEKCARVEKKYMSHSQMLGKFEYTLPAKF